MLSSINVALAALLFTTLASAHTILTYPGWRGNNLITNETYPYGMQWIYPCGGHPLTSNRTYWSTKGGALAFQPGWFQGHSTAFMQVNLGLGTDGPGGGPPNMSLPMVKPFQLLGPSNNPYPGTVCLPQIPLPENLTVNAGDLATIQFVMAAKHGAALYSCVDIEFREPGDPKIPAVNSSNCYNSTDLGFADIYTVVTKEIGERADSTVGNSAPGSLRLRARELFSAGNSAGAGLLGLMGFAPVVALGAWLAL